jgi:hypothetical protein
MVDIVDRAVSQDGYSSNDGGAWFENGFNDAGENTDFIDFKADGRKHLYTMRFDISDIPAGATITSATVTWFWTAYQQNATGIDGVNYVAKDAADCGTLSSSNDGYSWRDASNGGTTAVGTEVLPTSATPQASFTTADFSNVIQELVDSYGGSLGDLGLTVFPIGSAPGSDQYWGVHDNTDGGTTESVINISYTAAGGFQTSWARNSNRLIMSN